MKKKLSKYLSFTAIMLVCLGLGYLAGSLGFNASAKLPDFVLYAMLILFVPIFFITIGIHEGGHALAGVWVNFEFRMYVIGPFLWEKEVDGWHFKWNRNVNTAGGMVICLPLGSDRLSQRFSRYAAGGPVASLLLAILAFVVYRLLGTMDYTQMQGFQILTYFFLLLSFFSLIIFVVTAMPMHKGGFSTDGARVIRLLKGGDTARFEILLLKFIAGSASGLRPKLIDMAELQEAQILSDRLNAAFGVYLHSFFHQAAFDKGDFPMAEQHLLDYIREADKIPAGIRNAVWLDAAFFYAFAKHDLNEAQRYWSQFKPAALIPKAQVLATEAALAMLNKDGELLSAKIAASLRELPNMMDKGLAIALREKLLQMKEMM